MWQRNSAVGRGLHFGLGPQHENSTSLCCCLQGVRAQNCFTPLSAWQLPYIKCAPPKFHPLGNVWNVNSHCKPSPSISAPQGVLPKTNLAAYSFSCKTRALSYSVHNKINHLSFLGAKENIFMQIPLTRSEIAEVIPKVCLLLSSSWFSGSIWLLLWKGLESQSSHSLRL